MKPLRQKGLQLIPKWHCSELSCALNIGYTQCWQYPAAAVNSSACQSTVMVMIFILESPRKRPGWSKQAEEIPWSNTNTWLLSRKSYCAGAQRQLVILSTYKSWKNRNYISQPHTSCISLDCSILFVHLRVRWGERGFLSQHSCSEDPLWIQMGENPHSPSSVLWVKHHETEQQNLKHGLSKNSSTCDFFSALLYLNLVALDTRFSASKI